MKKAFIILVSLFAMFAASTSLKAQEVTIVLNPGWTWISYPGTEPIDIATALGSFTPMDEDMIVSFWSSSDYLDGEWIGDVDTFYPGYGYMYYSNRRIPVTLTFNVQPPAPQVVVTTMAPTDVTSNSATSGGSIATDAYVFAKGICWATHTSPTQMDDYYSENGNGDESFTAEMTDLSQNTTYYVRAYAVTQNGIAYGDEVSFTTIPIWTIEATPNPTEGGTITGAGDYEQNAVCTLTAIANEGYIFANWTENGEVVSTEATYTFTVDAARTLVANFDLDHTYVDLGLPSGTLWATCNLGANLPEEYGDYFAWGETQPKDNFSWTNYQYCMGSFNTLTKYCNNPDIGYNGFTDDLTTLLPEDDAATANWGDEWRMPTEGEWQELYENTTVTWTMRNGVRGRLFTAENGNSIFLPAAGYCNESLPEAAGIIGDYWTSSLDTDYPSGALSFFFNSSNYYISFCNRLYGRNVRAVRPSQGHPYVDLGLPSGTLWATCNVGANAPEEYGDYFAWGETTPKDYYDWSNYQYCNGSNTTFTKYCNNSSYGYNGFTDNQTTLLPEDDAATVNWGADWRMPSPEECEELYENTSHTWTTLNGVNGRLFTGPNGNSLFLPAAGACFYTTYNSVGVDGYCWTNSLYTDNPIGVWYFYFFSGNCSVNGGGYRVYGIPVRAVRTTQPSITEYSIIITPSPAEGGAVSGDGTYQLGQTCTVTALANNNFTFINWTENNEVVSTNASYTFTVSRNRTLVANFTYNGSGSDHDYVDLGLPSGLLWATCNVGADSPEDYGDYFAWGETQPKEYYDWSTYQYCMGTDHTLTKYCNNSSYGYNGFTDNLTVLLPEDDAATANWGDSWRMPSDEEWDELYQSTTCTWINQNGVYGRLFVASNGNSIFLPAAGYRCVDYFNQEGNVGFYWSSSLSDYPDQAWRFVMPSDSFLGNCIVYYGVRLYGHSVRPVRATSQNNTLTGAIDGKFTINENGNQVYFSQGNLQYQASTNMWRFATNQYDYIGSDNNNISLSYTGWIDLFGWGTSGWNSGNTYYHPWDSNNISGSMYGPRGQYDLIGSYANADWGVYNPISNGGNQANQWRTLTRPEWDYVFNTRSTTSGIRYAKANVNNVNGVILLPDNWSSSTYSLSSTNTYNASFSSNTLAASEWNTLEQAGAVFLPAAGYRNGTSVGNVGSSGSYWSASYGNIYGANHLSFSNSNLITGYDDRYIGRSVRLVRVAEN